MAYNMSFIGGWSDTSYYSTGNTDLNDTAYTIGAVVVVGASTSSEAIFSSLGTNTGYELRTGGASWISGPAYNDNVQTFAGQSGSTSLGMQTGPNGVPSTADRILFVCMTSTDNAQRLYRNGILVAYTANPTAALAVESVFIGNRPGLGYGATNILISSVFYADSAFTAAQIRAVYRWLGAYGRLPDDGTGGGVLTSITHFWDVFDNKTAARTTWTSRGATGGKVMSLTGTGLSIAGSGHAVWGD